MQIKLAYGRTGLTVNLPDQTDVIEARFIPGLANEAAAILEALRQPIGSAPLASRVKPGDRVVIVHTDLTRATPNDRIMPVLLAELESAGVRRSDITLLNALGTHRRQTEAELREMLGDPVVEHYHCLQHDAFDNANLASLGQTSLGHPVRVNRTYLEADVRILAGFIEPHFFAGFSGGPKGVLPSIAGAESVLSNHSYELIGHPRATWGVTVGNPIWEEMREVALLTKPTFLLNVTLNAKRQITGVFAGDMLAAHAAGCNFVREQAMVKVEAPYDIVVTTNSGYPLDQNLYQSVKGMSAANQIVRDGASDRSRIDEMRYRCGGLRRWRTRPRPIRGLTGRGRFAARDPGHAGPAWFQRAGSMAGSASGADSAAGRGIRLQRRPDRRTNNSRPIQAVQHH